MSNVPDGAQLSDDGQWWWDGSQWQPVSDQSAASGQDSQTQASYSSDSTQSDGQSTDTGGMCKYPTVYVQDGAPAPSSGYEAQQSGVSPAEVGETLTHLATMAPDAYKAATNAQKAYTLYTAGADTAAADAAAAEALGAAGAFAIGAVILLITLTDDPPRHCGNVCPHCTASENSTSEWLEAYLCTELEGHGDEHCCSNQHTWFGTPVGTRIHDGEEAYRGG